MFFSLISDKRFLPTEYVNTIFEINYSKLYEEGIRLILTDLDNTLISYKEQEPLAEQYAWVKEMKDLGFEIIIVSNNSHKQRVSRFAQMLGVDYVNFATKPLKRGLKKALKKAQKKYQHTEVVAIGDQLMTDIFAANRMGFYSILVKAIDRKTEIVPTKINRKLERYVLNSMRKHHPNEFQAKLLTYYEDNYED